MSSCSFVIQFDREDRQFLAGEEVSGTVVIKVEKNISPNGVIIGAKWATHGKGNIQQETYFQQRFPASNWITGQTHEFSFRFRAKDFPPTYRGTYLNVDHYVFAQVDLSWAFDPIYQEDFIVVPTDTALAHQTPVQTMSLNSTSKSARTITSFIGLIMAIAGIAFSVVSCGITLVITLIGLWLVFAAWRNVLAEKMLNTVSIIGVDNPLPAGTSVPIKVRFTPRRNFRIDGIQAKFSGREECVSGSGTNQMTHRHKLHEQTFDLAGAVDCYAGQQANFEFLLPTPETAAYSLYIKHNQILWDLDVRIKIPRWPDWLGSYRMLVVPNHADLATSPPLLSSMAPSLQASGQGNDVEEGAPGQMGADMHPSVPGMRTDLESIAGRLQELDRSSEEATAVVQQYGEFVFQIRLLVDRVASNYEQPGDSEYTRGRTIYGNLPETNCTVIVQLPEHHNESVARLDRGDIWTGVGAIIKWDGLYQRLEMLGM